MCYGIIRINGLKLIRPVLCVFDQTTLNWLKTWSQSPYWYGYSAMVSTCVLELLSLLDMKCVRLQNHRTLFLTNSPHQLHWSMSQFGMVDQLLKNCGFCLGRHWAETDWHQGLLARLRPQAWRDASQVGWLLENPDFFGGDQKKRVLYSQKAREKRWKTAGCIERCEDSLDVFSWFSYEKCGNPRTK